MCEECKTAALMITAVGAQGVNTYSIKKTGAKMNGIKRLIGRLIWNFSESFHISLGNHGPTIFGWMIGAKGKRIDNEQR